MAWYQYNGQGRIFVLDDYHPYRKEVVRYLDLIGSTYSGRTLFRYCNMHSGRRIEIIPFVPTAESGPVNAGTDNKSINDAYVEGEPVRNTDGSVVAGATGTGLGSDVTLKYHPANQRQFVANMKAILPGS